MNRIIISLASWVGDTPNTYIYIYVYIWGACDIIKNICQFIHKTLEPISQFAAPICRKLECLDDKHHVMSMAVCHCTQDLTYNVHGIFLRVASPFRSVKDSMRSANFPRNCVRFFVGKSGEKLRVFEIWACWPLVCQGLSLVSIGTTAGSFDGFGMVEIHFAPAKNVRVFGVS